MSGFEPQFDRVGELERARSRRLLIIVGLMVGPSAALAALGLYDAAGLVFFISLIIGIALVFIHERAELVEGAELLGAGRMRSVALAAAVAILLGMLPHFFTSCLTSWFR